jgi:hypothetical protein
MNFMRRIIQVPYLLIALMVLSIGYMISCTHDDEILSSGGAKITRGNSVLLPGAAGDTSKFKLDKAHCNVMWSTNYLGAAGLLTGRFNQFGMADVSDAEAINYTATGQPLPDVDWAFYENDPAKTFFNGYVQINTSNTGEPARDGGCNITTLGTVPIVTGTQNLTLQNIARIKTTKVEFDPSSNGYIVTLNLTWQGKLATPLTKSIVGKLSYVPRKKVQFGTAAAFDVFGLQLKFQFNCRDFGIASTSIADNVQIECNMNFNNK